MLLCVTALFAFSVRAASVCGNCHPREAARFAASSMAQSMSAPQPLPSGRVEHSLSDAVITSESRGQHMIHRISEKGITAEYEIAYQIGSGKRGRTYAVRIGDYLEESPISWYNGHGWDVSPGFEALHLLDADRPITSTCLFCHADQPKFADEDGRRLGSGASVNSIACDRCHGPGDEHAKHPSVNNIVNPAKLSGAQRDGICEQCHLEGDTRVVNPGKREQDYRPGELLEQTIVPYLLRRAGEERPAVSQVEELAQSKCARASGGRLWCGTCHDPHGEPVERKRQIREICMSCHTSLSQQSHPTTATDCAACHMPRRSTSNIAHVSVTDHRIQRPGSAAPSTTGESDTVFPWRQPDSQLQQRDLALAELEIGYQQKLPEMLKSSIQLLQGLPAAQQSKDPDVLANLEVVYLQASAPQKALALAQWAVDAEPRSATFALNLGIASARAGRVAEAEQQLQRAIDLDPSLMQAYAELAVLYDREQRTEESKATLERFLKWNPQSIQFRLALKQQ